MEVAERIMKLVAPVVQSNGLDLYDIELASGILRVTVDGANGVDVDAIGEISHAISRLLDEEDIIKDDRYLLEVSSPGIERRLRLPQHFQANAGADVRFRLKAAIGGLRRFDGKLVEADDSGILVEANGEKIRIAYDDVEQARTIFDWSTALSKSSTSANDDEGEIEGVEADEIDLTDVDSDDEDEIRSESSSTKKASAR